MNFSDLIYTADNVFPDELCDHLIGYHHQRESIGMTEKGAYSNLAFPRDKKFSEEFDEPKESTDSRYLDRDQGSIETMLWMNDTLKGHWEKYQLKFNNDWDFVGWANTWPRMNYDVFQIQHYEKNKGHFGAWHMDHKHEFPYDEREYVYIIYLNDVAEGGETQFLHVPEMNCKPEKGKLLFFPVTFPFVHRGTIPRSNDKYIITGWLCRARVEDACNMYQSKLVALHHEGLKK